MDARQVNDLPLLGRRYSDQREIQLALKFYF